MRKLMFVTIFVLMFGLVSSTSASIVWNGPTGDWTEAAKWDKGYVPINDGDEIKLTGGDSLVCTVSSVQVDYSNKIAIARDSTLEILTGGYIGSGNELKVGDAGATGSGTDIGYLLLKGGQISINSNSKLEVGYKAGGDGRFTISGGSLTGGRLYVGGASAAGAIGKVTVVGSTATIISMAELYVGASSSSGSNPGNGTLDFQIDSGGVTSIDLSGTAYLDPAGESSTAALLLGLLAVPPSGPITLIDSDNVVGTFDTFTDSYGTHAATEGATVTLNYGGTDYVYTLTYNSSVALIPEPATLVLFGLGGLLLRRRR